MEFSQIIELLLSGLGQTLLMTILATFFAYIVGVPLGVILTISELDLNLVIHV